MNRAYDVIVAGLGTMGAATMRSLRARGLRVLGIDRFHPPHALGEHAGRQRMFRMSYYEHPDYVPLLRRAFAEWTRMRTPSGARVFERTGALYLGRPDGDLVSLSARAARIHGLSHEIVDAPEIAKRWPMLRPDADHVGLWEADAGFIRSESAVEAMLWDRTGADAGSAWLFDEPVLSWDADGSGVEVRTARSGHHAGALVVTAGPWSAALLRGAGVRLTVTRQVQAWTRPLESDPFGIDRQPCWAIELSHGLLYGFPRDHGAKDVKAALHRTGDVTDPDRVTRSVTGADTSELLSLLDAHVPRAGPLSSASVCLYTNSLDGHFIIDRHPEHANVVLGCGFSGHGFKFAPVIGDILADMAVDHACPHPAPFLSLRRLADKHP